MFIKKEELNEIREKLGTYNNRFAEIEKENKKLKGTIKFLCKHNRDEIVAEIETLEVKGFYYDSFIVIKYINEESELCKIQTDLNLYMQIKNIENISKYIYVLHFADIRDDEECKECEEEKQKDKFLQLDTFSNEITDITDIKARYENQEKVSAHLKESAQALSEVVKDFFKAKDTHQKLNEKTTTAKKTKKTTRGKQNDKQVQGK